MRTCQEKSEAPENTIVNKPAQKIKNNEPESAPSAPRTPEADHQDPPTSSSSPARDLEASQLARQKQL